GWADGKGFRRFIVGALVVVAAIGAETSIAAVAPATFKKADIKPAARYFEALEAAGKFSGAVLIASGGRILLERGYGFADVELGVEMTPDLVFRIGSLTKPVTASAVLVTIQAGELSLDAMLCDYIESCPAAWGAVTIEHLLTHTSGVKDHFGDLESAPVERTVEELDRVLKSLPANESLNSAPGEAYAYSNFNYVLLGAVLERVHGRPWEAVMKESVFDPLGLKRLSYDDVYEIVPGRVRGYGLDDDGNLKNIEYDDHAAYAAGGLKSTISDFYGWSQAAISGSLFAGDLHQRAFTPYKDRYGYGWQIREFFGRKMYNHTGGIDGFSAHIAYYGDSDLTVIVFSNVEDDPAILRACDAANLIFQWSEPSADPLGWEEMQPGDRCGVNPPAKDGE
ncbi:MAG: serine hydrolase domain-containing protein, partial [Parvularculaceae bacterium]